jgi:hypothetical protein
VASQLDCSTNTCKLECSWPAGRTITFGGLSPEHRERVQEIGLAAWMEEYAHVHILYKSPPVPAQKMKSDMGIFRQLYYLDRVH